MPVIDRILASIESRCFDSSHSETLFIGMGDVNSSATVNHLMAQFREITHDLKGMGGAYGFDELSQLAAKLMFLLEGENYEAIDDLLEEIDNVFQRIYKGAGQAGTPQQTATG